MPDKTHYFLRKSGNDKKPNAVANDPAQEAEQPMKRIRELPGDKKEINKAKSPEISEDGPVIQASGSHLLLALTHYSFSVNFKAYPNPPIVTYTVKLSRYRKVY